MELMLDTICSKRQYIRISGDDKPRDVVKSQFLKLNYEHTTEAIPKYLVFFKARDGDALNAAFREYSAVTAKKEERPSVIQRLRQINPLEKVAKKDKVRNKDG